MTTPRTLQAQLEAKVAHLRPTPGPPPGRYNPHPREPRIESLRRWCEVNADDPLALIQLKQLEVHHLLEAYRPAALNYKPKTTPEQRAAMLDIMGKNPLLQHGFKMLLDDLKNAEAALNG